MFAHVKLCSICEVISYCHVPILSFFISMYNQFRCTSRLIITKFILSQILHSNTFSTHVKNLLRVIIKSTKQTYSFMLF